MKLTDELMIDRLKFCGCGDPESVLNLLHEFIEMVTKHRNENSPHIGDMEKWKAHCDRQRKEKNDFIKDWSNEVIWLLFYILDEKEIFEHGGNVSGGWLKDHEYWEKLHKWKKERIEDAERSE